MNAIDWRATGSATFLTTRFAAIRLLQLPESTTILAGGYQERQSNECGRCLQAMARGNLGITVIIYRNLVLPRRKSSEPSRRIASDLVRRSLMVRSSRHHLQNPRSQGHKGVSAWPHLPETMVKLAGDRPETARSLDKGYRSTTHRGCLI